MKIDRKTLNLIIPVEREDDTTLYVHAAPISREVFERYYLPVAKTFAAIYSQGLNSLAGPRVASMMLKQIATDMGVWEGPQGVSEGLMGEVRRMCNVLTLGKDGWAMTPMQDALDRGWLDADEISEVENALVFFTVASAMHHRKDRETMLTGAAQMWDAQISSQTCSELKASLTTSTQDDSSGEKAEVSSIPS